MLILVSLLCASTAAYASSPVEREDLQIWKDRSRGKAKVILKGFVPRNGNNAKMAVVICPGGSYFWLDRNNEGENMARSLCRKGIAAFVLSYRVAGGFNFIMDVRCLYGGNVFPAMLEDARCAIQTVRESSGRFGINPDKVGVMGFSAGGHLAMLTAELQSECRPDFVAAIYPVVTMSDKECVHKRSRRGIMGIKSGDGQLREILSVEKNVPDDCCPVFLLNCRDDKVVDYRNSVLLDSALTVKGIPHRYICLPNGGHGFGGKLIGKGADTYDWKASFADWAESL